MDNLSMYYRFYDEEQLIDEFELLSFLDSYVRSYRKLKADVERNK